MYRIDIDFLWPIVLAELPKPAQFPLVMERKATEAHAGRPLVKLEAIGDAVNPRGALVTGTSRCGAKSGSNAELTGPAPGGAALEARETGSPKPRQEQLRGGVRVERRVRAVRLVCSWSAHCDWVCEAERAALENDWTESDAANGLVRLKGRGRTRPLSRQ